MAKLTSAQTRKLLSRPASELSASELDTRREVIAAGRKKTKGGKKKTKARKRGLDVTGIPALLRKRRKQRGAVFE